jgi:hypothetical protein
MARTKKTNDSKSLEQRRNRFMWFLAHNHPATFQDLHTTQDVQAWQEKHHLTANWVNEYAFDLLESWKRSRPRKPLPALLAWSIPDQDVPTLEFPAPEFFESKRAYLKRIQGIAQRYFDDHQPKLPPLDDEAGTFEDYVQSRIFGKTVEAIAGSKRDASAVGKRIQKMGKSLQMPSGKS